MSTPISAPSSTPPPPLSYEMPLVAFANNNHRNNGDLRNNRIQQLVTQIAIPLFCGFMGSALYSERYLGGRIKDMDNRVSFLEERDREGNSLVEPGTLIAILALIGVVVLFTFKQNVRQAAN